MRQILFLFLLLSPQMTEAQRVQPAVYPWPNKDAVMLEGKAHDLDYINLRTCTLISGRQKIQPATDEQLIIVRSGELKVRLTEKDSTYAIGPGSVVMILPTESCMLTGDSSRYYLMSYRSASADAARRKNAGGSFVMDEKKIPFKRHDRGGIKHYFQHPTTMTIRFEMHVTTLNAGIRSHEPHRHKAEEIVILLEGKAEMQIADGFSKAQAGDVIFLASDISHALRNEGTKPCRYFAFQWE